MDFVVVGLMLGALAVLAGVVLLGWETGRWQRAAARAASSAAAARFLAIAADRRSTGEALVYAGAAIILATVGALAGSLDDRTGAFFVVTTVTVAAAGILLWAYLHRTRHPIPVTPPRVPRPVPPVRPTTSDFGLLFADPPDVEEETVEHDETVIEPVDEIEDIAATTPPEPADDAIDVEPVTVVEVDEGDADDEGTLQHQKAIGERSARR